MKRFLIYLLISFNTFYSFAQIPINKAKIVIRNMQSDTGDVLTGYTELIFRGDGNRSTNTEDSHQFYATGTWLIPDNGYKSVFFTNNNFAPTGAVVTRVRYVFFIDDQGDPDNFYCGDYEVWVSSSMTYGNVYEDVNVYNNLGARKDEGYDDDWLNDSDIDTDWGSNRETHYFDGESANQYWGIKVKDTYSGDVGQLENFGIRVYWELPQHPPNVWRNSPPQQNITINIYNNQNFEIGASDADGDLDEVKWYLDGTLKATHNLSGYNDTDNWNWDFDYDGQYVIKAKVYDDNNNTDYVTWNVTVINHNPTISKVTPTANNITVTQGDNTNFKVSVYEPDGEGDFDKVVWKANGSTFYTDNYNSWTWSNPHESSTSYTFNNIGTTTIKATVYDKSGASSHTQWSVTVINPNIPPNVWRSSPSQQNISVDIYDNQVFEVAAHDDNGDLDKVKWYLDGTLKATHNLNGYNDTDNWNWNFDYDGQYVIKAKVYDNNNNTDYVTWNVTVINHNPTISKVTPTANNITVTQGDNTNFRASVYEPDGEGDFDKVVWKANGSTFYTDNYNSWTWSNPHESSTSYTFNNIGTTTIKATVYDKSGASSYTEWSVTVNPSLVTTRIKDNDIFIDKTAKYGIPILLEAKLQYYQTLWWNLNGQTLIFEIYYNGTWHTIQDDGISSTSFNTNNGVASVYYTPPTSLSEGSYPIRVKYNGNNTYTACELQKNLTIHKPQWLFLVYLDGDNNLEGNAYNDYFNEMWQARNNSNVSIVVLFDRIPGFCNFEPDWENTKYLRMSENAIIANNFPDNNGEANVGHPNTLAWFLDQAEEDCLAENRALIFWNHGSGIMKENEQINENRSVSLFNQNRTLVTIPSSYVDDFGYGGVCFDSTSYHNALSIRDIRKVLNDESNFEIIGFDACVMGEFETIYDLEGQSDFIIASQEEEPSDGWEYQDFLPMSFLTTSTTPAQLSSNIVNSYPTPSFPWPKRTLGAWFNNSQINSLNTEISDFSNRLIELLRTPGYKTLITNARNNAQTFAPYSNVKKVYMSLRDFCVNISSSSNDPILITKANSIANRLVNSNFRLAWKTSFNYDIGGLSIYFPNSINSYGWFQYNQVGNLLFVNNPTQKWDDFLKVYFDEDTPYCTITEPNNGGWYSGNVTCEAIASDLSTDILYVEFQYSLNNQNWYQLPGPNSSDGKDWYEPDGWGLTFQTTNTPVHGTINDNAVWVRARSCDLAGNLSNWDVCDTPFGVDNANPSGTISINNGAPTTTFNIVTLYLTGADNLSGVTQMQFSNNGTNWSDWESFSTTRNWNLFSYGGNTNYGIKTVYTKFKDAAGNVSAVYNDQIEYISPSPVLGSFVINNNASTTSSVNVTLNNSATNNPTYYMASENSNFSGASWLPYSTAPYFILSSGYGTKTVYFKVKNSTGESNVLSDNINYVPTIYAPAVTYFAINNGNPTTTSQSVILNNSSTNNPNYYMASENANFNGASWHVYSPSPSFILSNGYGIKTVYFKVKNSAGNSNIVNDNIEYVNNTVPSNLPVQNVNISSGQTECYDATNTITVAGSGTTVNVYSGGEATFIAGQKVILEPGFIAYYGSYIHAYITTTGDYCSQQSSMVATDNGTEQDKIGLIKKTNNDEITIYPNPTNDKFTIDFKGVETTANIRIVSFQGAIILETEIKNQLTKELNIQCFPEGMYLIVINTGEKQIIKKIIKNY